MDFRVIQGANLITNAIWYMKQKTRMRSSRTQWVFREKEFCEFESGDHFPPFIFKNLRADEIFDGICVMRIMPPSLCHMQYFAPSFQ